MSIVTKHTKEIEGIAYTTTTLPASVGLVIAPKLLALLGEKVAALLFATHGEGSMVEELLQDPKVQGQILASIADKVAATDGLLIVRDLLQTTECNQIKIGETHIQGSVADHFDSHFAGRYGHLFRVALWVARINFPVL